MNSIEYFNNVDNIFIHLIMDTTQQFICFISFENFLFLMNIFSPFYESENQSLFSIEYSITT